MTCPRCNGSGKRLVEDSGDLIEAECGRCDGDGWVNDNEPCEFEASKNEDIKQSLKGE